jgi:Ca2+-transporting ATPase
MASLCLVVEAGAIAAFNPAWQTMVFSLLCLAQLANALAIRSESLPLWKLGFFTNRPLVAAVGGVAAMQAAVVYAPPLQRVFGTEPLGVGAAFVVVGGAALVYLAIELAKLAKGRKKTVDRPAARR